MSKAYEEMKKAEECLSLACGCQNCCAECPMNISIGHCVMTKLRAAITKQRLRDLRAECGEVI